MDAIENTDTSDPARAAIAERRRSPRAPCSGPIWWKGPDNDHFQQGWLIERSDDGAAFLARGPVDLLPGTRLQVSTSDPTDIGFVQQSGLVARTAHVHADLFLVAAQISPAR